MDSLMPHLPEDKKVILHDLKKNISEALSGTFDFKNVELSDWKGYRFLPVLEASTAKRFYEEVKLKENTVFMASFPRTGTSWTIEVLRQIMYGDDEKLNQISKNLPPALTALEVWSERKIDLLEYIPLPRILFSTHLPEALLNFEEIKRSNGKIVVVVRNPKDHILSWFHFCKNTHFDAMRKELSENWDQFFNDYIAGKHRLLTKPGEWYLDYLLGWYKHREDSNVLFVHLENMKKDPRKEIGRIAEFLDVEMTKERCEAIAKDTSFDSMINSQKDPDAENIHIQKHMTMLRKGQVGSWKEQFTVAQSDIVDKLIEEKLGHTDIKFTFDL